MLVQILIVDDHPAVRRSLTDWLSGHFPGFEILTAASGEEAVSLAEQWAPALVLMDLGLPGINGLEATRQIKALLPDCDVVMLTIHEGEAYRAEALAAGASDYVPKRTMQTALLPIVSNLVAVPTGYPCRGVTDPRLPLE